MKTLFKLLKMYHERAAWYMSKEEELKALSKYTSTATEGDRVVKKGMEDMLKKQRAKESKLKNRRSGEDRRRDNEPPIIGRN